MAGGGAELKALIFDLDGTLAETEELHRAAFNAVFAAHGLAMHWDVARYGELLTTTGGKRRLLRGFAEAQTPIDAAFATTLHVAKNEAYAALMAGGIALRPGVAGLLAEARRRGLALAIATTTSRANLAAFLRHSAIGAVDVLVAGEDVAALKPDPEAYHLALARLGIAAGSALAFEDSRNGVRAACAAGLRTIAIPGMYTAGQDFTGATVVATLEGFDLSRW